MRMVMARRDEMRCRACGQGPGLCVLQLSGGAISQLMLNSATIHPTCTRELSMLSRQSPTGQVNSASAAAYHANTKPTIYAWIKAAVVPYRRHELRRIEQ